jgi:hypothetical protein
MTEDKSARELLKVWLEGVMADKVMFNANIDMKFAKNIGLADNTLDNILRILREAAKELRGEKIPTGVISNILIEKNKGLWKIIVFKQRAQ